MNDDRESSSAATRAGALDNAVLFRRSCERMRERVERDPEIAGSMVSLHACNFMLHDCEDSIDFLIAACRLYRDRPALGVRAECTDTRGEREPLDTFTSISYDELWSRITACAAGFERLGIVRRGDCVGLVGFAGIDYVVAQYAAWYLGAVVAPLPTTLAVDELAVLATRANVRTLILDEEALRQMAELVGFCESLQAVVTMDGASLPENLEGGLSGARLADVEALGQTLPVPRHARARAGEDPVRMLLYTSGSTGLPKAAQITEAALTTYWRKAVSDFRGDPSAVPPVPRVNIGLAFMPMNHVRGQLNVLEALAQGGLLNFTYRRDLSTLFDDIRLARPTVIILVPRVAQAIYAQFQRELADLVRDGDEEAARATLEAQMRSTFLGDRLWQMRIGSAPVSDEMLQFLRRTFDVPVHTGYGSTEAGMILADDRVLRANVLELRLGDVPELGYASTDQPYSRGELLIRSRCMTVGYAGVDNATSGLFDADGFLCTGDIFERRSDDQYVWLGRKNNILKLAHGEFVSPWRLESLYASDSAAILQIFVYVNSLHSHVMAVVVPNPEWAAMQWGERGQDASGEIGAAIAAELRRIAAESGLRSYELPVDVMLEWEPFSTRNGFLTESGKLARKRLEARYGPLLDARYVREETARREALDALRGQADLPLEARVLRAMQIVLNLENTCDLFERNFRDHGGDSLDATELSALLEALSGIEIPPGMILDPRKDALGVLCQYITGFADDLHAATRYRAVHGDAVTVTAAQLCAAPFFAGIDKTAVSVGEALSGQRRILLTGANGFLGRVLLRELLDQKSSVQQVVCLVRAECDAAAVARLLHDPAADEAKTGNRNLASALASGRLIVCAGDLSKPELGLARETWNNLAATVDAIVHNGALVNHSFSYAQLYMPNVLGTVEVARLALSGKRKTVNFVSSIAVADLQTHCEPVPEHLPARELQPFAVANGEYGNGYALSKWAAEVVLGFAYEQFGLPVRIFRCGMLMPDTHVRDRANADDFLARLLLSLVSTNVAPRSFYQDDANPLATRSFYGLPVNHVARFMATLASQTGEGTETFHVVNRTGESASLDQIVDWLVEEGFSLERYARHADWFQQFGARLKGLEPALRTRTSLPILHQWASPFNAAALNRFETRAFEQRFVQLSAETGLPPGVPCVDREDVRRYIQDLGLVRALAAA